MISKDIYGKWQSIRDIRDEADIIRQQAVNKKKEQEEKLTHEHEEYKKNLAAKERELERQRDIQEENEKLEKEKVILSYRKTIKDLNHESGLYDLQLRGKLEEEDDNIKERSKDRERKNEEKALQQRLAFIEKELEEKKKLIEFNEIAKRTAMLEAEVDRVKGEVSAEVTERKIMANSANEIAIQKSLLEALPMILEAANKPMEKMGEIRAINISGLSDKGDNQSPIGSVLASATFLPLLKEIIQFISDWGSKSGQLLARDKEGKPNKSVQ